MDWLRVHKLDNVAVALEPLVAGYQVSVSNKIITLRVDIPAGHKFALDILHSNEQVIKYGMPIGIATSEIKPGDHIHVHNLSTALEKSREYIYEPQLTTSNHLHHVATFDGYRRKNGSVGTRNEVWVICTVGCVAQLAQVIARKANERYCSDCDGVYAFTHPLGCSQVGDDHTQTRNLLASLIQSPNAGGVLILGLGCENNQVDDLLKRIPKSVLEHVQYFNCQDVGDELEEGLKRVDDLMQYIRECKRESCPLSDLVLGMKCGGSDGLSGLTANPLVGRISDSVTNAGGAVLLTETPEMFGAEQVLMNRAASNTIFLQITQLINSFKKYFLDHGQTIYDNPSPGNKAGGITTLEEKSMGAVQKGGSALVTDVLDYGEVFCERGLTLLESPGNDAVSSTALAASGATMILFTTGRGTPLGFPVPTIKISSNSRLAATKKNWIDFDAEEVLHSGGFDVVAHKLLTLIIDVASGRVQTRSEINEQREIAIWKKGVTL